MVMISDPPAEVEERAVAGHWEGDLIIAKGDLQKVEVGQEHAENLLRQARADLRFATHCQNNDLEGAYTLFYDATRKSLVALLEIQGLRPTSQGGHIVVFEAINAQLHPPLGGVIQPFKFSTDHTLLS
jgi:hypothetical protein